MSGRDIRGYQVHRMTTCSTYVKEADERLHTYRPVVSQLWWTD